MPDPPHPIGVSATGGLAARDIAAIHELSEAVRATDGVTLKLNPDLMSAPPDGDCNDFCFYNGNHLVGYAQIDDEGAEQEITGAVLPAFRRRGIFRQLLKQARDEARRRGADRLLLVNYRASTAGVAAAQALGLPYRFSEYHMEAESSALPALSPGTVRLVTVGPEEIGALAQLTARSFGEARRSLEALAAALQQPGVRYYLAEHDGVQIGQIGVIVPDDPAGGVYLRGFGVVPEQRRRGYGRQLLAATLQAMRSEGQTRFSLDVATDNAQALSLYESCGFRATNIYDYHTVAVA